MKTFNLLNYKAEKYHITVKQIIEAIAFYHTYPIEMKTAIISDPILDSIDNN